MECDVNAYFAALERYGRTAAATTGEGRSIPLSEAVTSCIEGARAAHDRGNKLMYIGNGGSAAVASHMAIDYSNNGGMRALCFNDAAALTCLANDYGYPEVFSRQVVLHARPGDILVAISSSGQSHNILNAVEAARAAKCNVWTLSGFAADNPLRAAGDTNFYVSSSEYGFVEISHLALCHCILDLASGWRSDQSVATKVVAQDTC